jgi:hypothetical protein
MFLGGAASAVGADVAALRGVITRLPSRDREGAVFANFCNLTLNHLQLRVESPGGFHAL